METGHIVFGPLPCGDGRSHAEHPGLVVAVTGNLALVVVGTSQHLPAHPLDGQIVLQPERGHGADWTALGLNKPTQFDGIGGTVAIVRADKVRVIGHLPHEPRWTRAMRHVLRAAAANLQAKQQAVAHCRT